MSVFVDKQELLTSSDIPKSYWNLLDNSATFAGYILSGGTTDDNVTTPNGNKALTRPGAWNYPKVPLKVEENQIYTFSLSVRFADTSAGGTIRLYPDQYPSELKVLKDTAFTINEAVPNVWQHGFVTFKALKDATIEFQIAPDVNVKTYCGDYMVNKGVYPLDWNYSLNDIKSLLGAGKA